MASRAAYRQAFEPRIGPEAVEAYLAFRRTLVVGKLVAGPSWLILLIGIGLAIVPVTVIGGLLVVGETYYIWKHGWGHRRKAQRLAKRYLNLPDSAGAPLVGGDTQLFDVWMRLRARGAFKDQQDASGSM